MMFTPLEIKNRLTQKIGCVPIFKALVISALLHLLLFTVVTVVVEPALKLAFYPRVTFWGSILNQEAVSSISLSNKLEARVFWETPYSFQTKPVHKKRATFLKIRRISFSKKFQINSETIFNESRQQPKYLGRNAAQTSLNYFQRSLTKLGDVFTKEHNSPKLSAQANAIYFPKRSRKVTFIHLRAKKQVKGAANIFWNPPYQRDILYEPPLPEYRLRMDRTEGDFNLEFEFLVSPQGRVIAVKKLTSSGFPEIDAQAMRYLKKWQFAPSPREQWGRIRLNFKLR